MSKPAEGPWFVGSDDATDCPDHANSGLALVDTGRQGDWPIARLVEWNNVHMIAAAPDLFDGLSHMRWCATCAQGSWEDCEGGRAALAALAKAEGQPEQSAQGLDRG